MKATWKKIYHKDGTTTVLEDGRVRPEFECIALTPPHYQLRSTHHDLLMDRATAEKLVALRPDVYTLK